MIFIDFRLDTLRIPSQFDGLSETAEAASKSTLQTSKKRPRSTSSDKDAVNGKNRTSPSSPSVKTQLDKSNSDPSSSSTNGSEKKHNGSEHRSPSKSSKRRLSDNNLELNQSSASSASNSVSPQLQKPKVIQSPTPSNLDQDSSSSNESVSVITTDPSTTNKPIREAKKRSLIYTGNTREFLETAIAAGIIDMNGDEEDEDNEYVPPGGKVTLRAAHAPSSSSDDDEVEDGNESGKSSDDHDDDDDDDDDGDDDDDDDGEEEEGHEEDTENTDANKVTNEVTANEEPSESGIRWNVQSRPQRQTHLIRFDNISKQDGQFIVFLASTAFHSILF